ncbi:MAG: hypothetical protein L6Q71_10710, partial [Planctomycetes bacterium]|nr:hypothetical protein [Planctomycetota bacterium]
AVAGMAQNGLPMRANGIDAIAWINGAQVRALNGFHFAYSSAYADIDIDLSQRFGRGSFTNTITRALNLDFTTAGTYSLAGYRPITNMYDGDVFKISQPNNALEDPFSNELLNAGVIDRVEFSVFKNRPDSNVRSGLGVQLTGELDGREYISIQNFQSAHLGGLPTAEGVVGTFSNTLVMGAGTISQIAREGAFNLEGPPAQISHAIAIIDRAIKETVRTQSFLGTYQVVTLDSNRDFLSSLQSSVAQTAQDLSTVDIAREVTEMTGAQLRVQAAAGILAQANSLPQTLLTLLR